MTTPEKNTPKKTTEMSAAERRNLQSKLDSMLAQAISDVHALGYETYGIIEKIRMTNNKSRLGSASVKNGARLYRAKGRGCARERWDKPPVFQISISTRECASDSDIKDTLYHEVIHCIPDCFNHGKSFKAAALRVNAAYGTNVETRKKEESSREGSPRPAIPCSDKTDKQLKAELLNHIGETVKIRRRTFTFVGLNSRPKNCCVLQDSRGIQYVCNVRACAHGLGLE